MKVLGPEGGNRFFLPHLGQRILKTTIAVFLCLVIYYLRGYYGRTMPTESAITAIVCMQPYVRDSREYALNRLTGTLVGTFWGLLFMALDLLFPSLDNSMIPVYGLMAMGVMASLYTTVLLKKTDASGLAAIVFLCIVISYPEISEPLKSTGRRILDVFIGTAVAVAVNVFRLPREKRKDQVFFLRTKDLVPDRYSQIPAAALFRLNFLNADGARICLMSEHAPAFFTQQMNAARVNLPLIVMDGAAIYDVNENKYLAAETIPAEDSLRLRQRLEELGLGYFIYTVHNHKTCIFHRGKLSIEEKLLYDRLKRTPYRSYLEGENYDLNEVVYFKIVALDKHIQQIEYQLYHALPKGKLRAVIRPQSGTPGISGLYIYAHTATMEQAQKRMMEELREKEPQLVSVPLRLERGFTSDRDALHLLNQVEKRFEPVKLFRGFRKSPV